MNQYLALVFVCVIIGVPLGAVVWLLANQRPANRHKGATPLRPPADRASGDHSLDPLRDSLTYKDPNTGLDRYTVPRETSRHAMRAYVQLKLRYPPGFLPPINRKPD